MSDSMDFQQTLAYWTSDVHHPQQLVERMFKPGTRINSATARKIHKKVTNLFKTAQPYTSDLIALIHLKNLIATLPKKADLSSCWRSGKVSESEQKINDIISKVILCPLQCNPRNSHEMLDVIGTYLPHPGIANITLEYASINDQEIQELATAITALHRSNPADRAILKLVRNFFSIAHAKEQDAFFNHLLSPTSDIHLAHVLLLTIIRSLPKAITQLHLSNTSGFLQNQHMRLMTMQMPNLKQLDLSTCPSPLIAAIANSPYMSNLQQLNLASCTITDTGLATLVNSSFMSNLQELDLALNAITDAGLTRLANSPYMSSLQKLNLIYCPITDAVLIAIANSPYMSHLRELDLRNCAIKEVGISAIANSPYMARLNHLTLPNGKVLTSVDLRELRTQDEEEKKE